MFTVKIVGDTRGILPKNSVFQIRHLRERERSGNRVVNSTHGGYTVMVCQDNSRIFVSRCHENDQFNRRVGILTCLQKYVGDVFIEDYKFREDGVTLYLDINEKPYPTWIKGLVPNKRGESGIPEVTIHIRNQTVQARTHKMREPWTVEAAQDIKA